LSHPVSEPDDDGTNVPKRPHDIAVLLDQMSSDVTAIKADMDRIMQPLVDSLKRNKYFDELQDRLRKSDKVSQAWRDWPLITGIHEAVISLRQSDNPDKHLLEHLQNLLFQADVTEFGLEGQIVDPEEVEVIASSGTGTVFTVAVCSRPGLKVGSLPLRKPIVEIARSERTAS